MKAIVSDVHGNLEALRAVLDDAAQQGATSIYCLGDLVGYGPDPRACLDMAMDWDLVLLGNHEHAVLFDTVAFNPTAQRAALWTRAQLEAQAPDRDTSDRRWEFLGSLQPRHTEGDVLYVHGSPRRPLDEYVLPGHVLDPNKLPALFQLVNRVCFLGHSHVPGVFTEELRYFSPGELDYAYRLDGAKAIVNVGSVGQPRDRDWRACYVLLDGDTVRFRRVEYDVDATVEKIRGIGELNGFLARRLREGR